MPNIINPNTYIIAAAGGAELLLTTTTTDLYFLEADGGAVTLLNNQSFDPTGAVKEGMRFQFEYGGDVILNGFSLSVFGYSFSPNEALAKYIITATYKNAVWEVKLAYSANNGTPSVDGANIQDGTIPNSKFILGDFSLTNIAPLSAEGIQLKSDAAGVLVEYDVRQAGMISVGDGVNVFGRFINGAFVMDSNGLATLEPGVVFPENLGFEIDSNLVANILIPSAEIQTLFSNPIVLVPAVAGAYIEVIDMSAYMFFAGVAYTGFTALQMITSGATTHQFSNNTILQSTVERGTPGVRNNTGLAATDTVFRINQDLLIQAVTGNPATGTSDAFFSILYRLVTP